MAKETLVFWTNKDFPSERTLLVASLSLPRGLVAITGAKGQFMAGSLWGAMIWRDMGNVEQEGSFLELSAL